MKYILSLDVGTTNIRSYIYTTEGKPIFAHSESVEIISKELGASEMDPGHIWDVTLSVTRRAVHWAKNENIKLECVGISLQRNTGQSLLHNKPRGQRSTKYSRHILGAKVRKDSLKFYHVARCPLQRRRQGNQHFIQVIYSVT